jgi:hypothetical protein
MCLCPPPQAFSHSAFTSRAYPAQDTDSEGLPVMLGGTQPHIWRHSLIGGKPHVCWAGRVRPA